MTIENAETDWNALLADYNSVKETNFTNPKDMLEIVYAEKRTYNLTGKVFLLTGETIKKYMKKWGLKCLPKGHRWPSPCLRAIMALGDVSNLSVKEIAKQVGFSAVQVGLLLRRNGIIRELPKAKASGLRRS